MKKKLTSKSFLFKLRISTAAVFLLTGTAAVLLAMITTAPAVGKVDLVAGDGSNVDTDRDASLQLVDRTRPAERRRSFRGRLFLG